ncbi:MAG: RNA polymerase factor sigma-54 [Nitrospirae bacterium]|nr:RNA polymerase factor sigma-54 [Nitrospirota bacterium]
MVLENRLEIKLSQKLILTPQLLQSIKLLQLPHLELSQILNQEIMENPFLEEVIEENIEESIEETKREDEINQDLSDDINVPLEKLFGFTVDDYFEEKASDGRDLGYFTDGMEDVPVFERNTNRCPDLYEYLLWQLRFSRVTEQVYHTAEVIIGNLNEDGYIQASIEEIAKVADVDIDTAKRALSLIQGFDPPGVGAKNLQECLLLQLKLLNLDNTLVEKILTDGFTELNGKKYKQLAIKFKVGIEDILSAVKIIEGLEPRPGRNYSREDAIYIVPDVFIEESEGEFVIILNEEGIPKLRLSNYYRKLLSNKNTISTEERKFLKEKLDKAIWLFKSIEQRNKTIYRVTDSILKFQEDFFRKGMKYLKPLALRDVAMDLGMHESTVSRATSNKYMQCSQGLFNFKSFFSNRIPKNGDVSSTSVKEIIKEVIINENHHSPLNDKQLVEILKVKNINVAIRTVAKYREELKIPLHSRRKKWF